MLHMPTTNKRTTVNLTDEQLVILRKLADAAGFKSLSAYMKHLIGVEAVNAGEDWPDDENAWGDISRITGED